MTIPIGSISTTGSSKRKINKVQTKSAQQAETNQSILSTFSGRSSASAAAAAQALGNQTGGNILGFTYE